MTDPAPMEPKAGPSKSPASKPKKGAKKPKKAGKKPNSPKKGGKKPQRIVTRNKIAGARTRIVKKIKRKKRELPPAPAPQPVEISTPEDDVVPAKPFMPICIFWLYEILHVTCEAWKSSWLKKVASGDTRTRVSPGRYGGVYNINASTEDDSFSREVWQVTTAGTTVFDNVTRALNFETTIVNIRDKSIVTQDDIWSITPTTPMALFNLTRTTMFTTASIGNVTVDDRQTSLENIGRSVTNTALTMLNNSIQYSNYMRGNFNKLDQETVSRNDSSGVNKMQPVPINLDLVPSFEDTWSFVIAASVMTICFSIICQNRGKFYPAVLSMAAYGYTAVCGIILTFSSVDSYYLYLAAVVGHAFWLMSDPLRFWLIFSQYLPIENTKTRLIVMANVIAIYVVDYIWTIGIGSFTKLVYAAVFTILSIIMAIWLSSIIYMYKQYTRIPDDYEKVMKMYEKQDLEENFESRQTLRHLLTFLPLLYPWSAFLVTRNAIGVTVNKIDGGIHRYRLDLIAALITIPCVSFVLWKLKAPRYEIQDLMALALGHIFNVLALSLFFYTVFNSPLTRISSVSFASNLNLSQISPDQTTTAKITARMKPTATAPSVTTNGRYEAILEELKEKNVNTPDSRPRRFMRLFERKPAPKFLIVPMVLAGVGLGIAPVCYFHFLWIQCPFRWRAPIIATCFTTNYIFGWATRTYLTSFNQYQILGLLVLVGVCAVWHILFSAYFWYNMEAPEQSNSNNVRF